MSRDFTDLCDLAQERLGGAVVYANDEFFAEKDNLLKAARPVFIEGKYTDRGKWMDGWETRRRRTPGHDHCVIRLGVPGVVRGLVVDTAFFRGNFPEACSLEGCVVAGHPDPEELAHADWVEVLPRTTLLGDTQNRLPVDAAARFTHLRFHIYPDGGVARLRVHGEALPDRRWSGHAGVAVEADLAALEHGGAAVLCNDMFFGSRHHLLLPGRGINMGDGWETRRSRRPGPDWALIQLATAGVLHRVEIDTNHFKGNAPESAAVLVCHAPGADAEALAASEAVWSELLPRTRLQPHARHFFDVGAGGTSPAATHALLRIWPDGGVSRLRLYGTVTREGREALGLRHLRALLPHALAAALRGCCGSSAWVQALVERRPFASLAALQEEAAARWRELSAEAVHEALRAHPRIGERRPEVSTGGAAQAASEHEQAHVHSADAALREALAAGNRAYEERFGHIYLVRAAGRSAAELLAILQERLGNDAATELQRAAAEQEQITALRLERMVLG